MVGTSACTILFNSNDLPRISDAPVGAIDAHENFDVDPAAFSITAIDPGTLVEGTGSAGGRPALVILTGANIADDVTVQLVPGADAVPIGFVVGKPTVSSDHTMVAVPITVPEIDTLADGAQLHLKLKATQTGGADQMQDVIVSGLDPFTASGTVDVSTLKASYSSATFSAKTTFTGSAPVHLRVTGGITIDAAVDVDAGGATPGPGGCAGGTSSAVAGCSPGGGSQGTTGLSGASGGGGGFADPGSTGSGAANGNGTGGAATGDKMLVLLDYDPGTSGNRGNGGGLGGGGVGNGGAGGGGGGTIELTAGGTITIMNGGTVSAAGGSGTAGMLTGGDGGNGSGGAVLVRTGAGVSSSGVWISANGAATGNGGAGSLGRIRVDTPMGAVVNMATSPHAHQGPSWATTATTIVQTANANLPLIGESGRTYGLIVNGTVIAAGITLAGTSTTNVPVTLTAGRNKVCAVADTNSTSSGNDFALECLDVVYLP